MKADRWLPYMLISPSVIVLGSLVAVPFLFVLGLSLFDSNLLTRTIFVGLDNYLELLRDDPHYWQVLKNTVVWTVGSVTAEYLLSLGLALLLNLDVPGKRFFRGILLLPWVVPPVTAALIWLTFFDGVGGVFNHLLAQAGLPPQDWLVHSSLVLPSLMVVAVWKYSPFMTVSLLAGLQSIPRELYEAAAVDGASGWRGFRYVTFPLLMPITTVLLIIGTIWRFGHFDLVQLMTGGGPANASELLSTYAYDALILRFDAGTSAAIAVTGVMILTGFIVLYIRRVGGER